MLRLGYSVVVLPGARSALTLFMARVLTDHHDDTVAADGTLHLSQIALTLG